MPLAIPMIRTVSATVAIAALLSCTLVDAARCHRFQHDPLDRESLKRSVLSITVRGKSGTAFLVDSEYALFLTAHHVVEDIQDETQIRGLTKSGLNTQLSLIAFDPHADVALLQAVDKNITSGLLPFELSLSPTKKHEPVMMLGAGMSDKDFWQVRHSEPSELQPDKDDLYILNISGIKDGDSGSPVVRYRDRLAVGIVLQKRGNGVGRVRGIHYFEHLLAEQSQRMLPERLQKIFGLTATEVLAQDFANAFVPRSGISNFNLLGLISTIANGGLHAVPTEVNGCDFTEIGSLRELGRHTYVLLAAIENIAATKDPLRAANFVFAFANKLEIEGDIESATSAYSLAADLFGIVLSTKLSAGSFISPFLASLGYRLPPGRGPVVHISEYLPQPPSTGLSAQQLVLQAIPSFRSSITPDHVRISGRQSDLASSLFHDYLSARIKSRQSNHFGFSPEAAKDILLASVWGATTTPTPAYRALYYRAMGLALTKLDSPEYAAMAYASAWQQGLQTDGVRRDYDFARNAAGPYSDALRRKISDTDQSDAIYAAKLRTIIEKAIDDRVDGALR